jgi:LPS-assembly lipoprotein
MTRIALACLLALLVPACGFHLRNALTLPPDLGPVRVAAQDPYSPLAQSLEQALRRAGAEVVEETARDGAVLDIVSERWANTPLSVDAQGRALEYTLHYAVFFELRDAEGAVVVPQQGIELTRDYVSPPENTTGTESESEILARELRREMIAAVLRRIDAAARGVVGE